MNREKNFLSAVVYVHNSANYLEPFLKMLIRTIQENFEQAEIICVDDDSTDHSVDIITDTCKNVENLTITLLNMSYFHGLEGAMEAGVELAIGDFVMEFDMTCQDYQPDVIMQVYKKALEGYDVVSAVPDRKQKLSSKIFYRVFKQFSNANDTLKTERFRILSRRVINRIADMNKSIPYRKAAYANCGLETAQVLYQPEQSSVLAKSSKEEQQYRMNLAIDTLILFTNVGYRFSIGMTIMMMLFAVMMAVYCLVIYVSSTPVEGWTTTVLFLAVAFFGLFGILTVIIKYLQILVNLVFKRKQYSFKSIKKLTQ